MQSKPDRPSEPALLRNCLSVGVRALLLASVLLGASSVGCGSGREDAIRRAEQLFAAENYEAARTALMDAPSIPRKYEILNEVDRRIEAVSILRADLSNLVRNAEKLGKEMTKERLQALSTRAPDAATRAEVQEAVSNLEALFSAPDPSKKPAVPDVPLPPRVEAEPVKRIRTVDEKPPADGVKKQSSRESLDPRVAETLHQVDEDARNGHYRRALAVLAMLASESGAEALDAIAATAEEVRRAAEADLALLAEKIRRAAASEARATIWSESPDEDLAKFLDRLGEYPQSYALERLQTELASVVEARKPHVGADELASRLSAGGGAAASVPAFLREGARSIDFEARLASAGSAFRAGAFDRARDEFLAAAGTAPSPVAKSWAGGLAEDASRLASLLERIGAALARDPGPFRDFDAGGGRRGDLLEVSGRGLSLSTGSATTEVVPWRDLSAATLRSILQRFGTPSAEERLGHSLLLSFAGADRDAEGALKLAIDADAGLEPVVHGILARRRGIEVPSYGFVWHQSQWMTFRERETQKLAERMRDLLAKLESASSPKDREAASRDLQKLGNDATEALVLALREKRSESIEKLRKGGLPRKLAPLLEERARLDEARRHALELIFDEKTYFYPYKPPECPPEKAKLYWPVQSDVDGRVAAVHRIWGSDLRVGLGGAERTLRILQEVDDRLHELQALGLESDATIDLLLGLDAGAAEVSIRDLAVTRDERRKRIEYDRSVALVNATVATSLTNEERQQLAVTNAYRQMFGRRALAVNEKLVQSARKHSRWMSDSGVFSHFSTLPNLRSPFDRMRAEGYERGVSENIAMAAGPEGAHAGWIRSSGHHRNILMASHTELGVGASGWNWTQNFGTGAEYRKNATWPE